MRRLVGGGSRRRLQQRGIDHIVLNAAVYRPTEPVPAWTDDGYEMSFGATLRSSCTAIHHQKECIHQILMAFFSSI